MGVRANTRRLRQLIHGLEAGADATAKAGLRQSGEAGTHRYENGHTVMDIAPIHEFGAPQAGIPKRPVVAHVGTTTATDAARIIMRGIEALHRNPARSSVIESSLKSAADMGARAMATRVRKPGEPPPPNAPTTVAAKGFDNPLFETGKLARSYESWTT